MTRLLYKTLTHIQIQQLIMILVSRNWDWEWKGIDGNSLTLHLVLMEPNLLGAASLTATLLDINYTPITTETTRRNKRAEEILEIDKKI